MNSSSIRRYRALALGAALLLSWVGAAAGAGKQHFPATGQTSCWDGIGNPIACVGTGQDGDIRAGAPLKYKDTGKGTIKDQVTGLEWAKKSDDDSIHDKDIWYTWDEAFVAVQTLNSVCQNDDTLTCSTNAECNIVGGKCGFAGKRDWRVPNAKEVQSIVNYDNSAGVSEAFNNNCIPGVSVVEGSCMGMGLYWSSTTVADSPNLAWGVTYFDGGFVGFFNKQALGFGYVRAVRGGL